jgi:hypothetical protein
MDYTLHNASRSTTRVDCDTLDDLGAPTSPEKAMLSSRNKPRKGRTVEVWRIYLVCDKGCFIGREVSLLKGYQNHEPFL